MRFEVPSIVRLAVLLSATTGKAMRSANRAAGALVRRQDGSLSLWFAVSLPVLMVVSGMSLDYARYLNQSTILSAAVDASALAAAREMSLTNSTTTDLGSVAKIVVEQHIAAQKDASSMPPVTVQSTVEAAMLEVTVNANHEFTPHFAFVAQMLPREVKARSVARVVGKPNICVLALEPSELGAVWLAKSARMTGEGCSVFSNSKSSFGMVIRDAAELKALSVCSAGGIEGNGNVSPQPISDCPSFEDPLASRPEPAIGSCTYTDTVIANQTTTLSPGVYCGGLRIEGDSRVTFESGEYIIATGVLRVADTSKVEGDGVSFFLGASTWLYFGADTSIKLKAMKSGGLAGLLFFGSRGQSKLITHTILSKSAQELVGTIYFPRNSFVVDGEASVGSSSAYTAIVARRVVLLAGPHLVLNSNYNQTDVPVPAGIRGATMPARLVQ